MTTEVQEVILSFPSYADRLISAILILAGSLFVLAFFKVILNMFMGVKR